MPIRNLWSFNPGELRVVEQIQEQLPGCAVYFPVRDVGIDLLVTKGGYHCSIQVKESRYYVGKRWRNSWHQVSQKNLGPNPTSRIVVPDFFVFLTHVPHVGQTGRASFKEVYLIVPTTELLSKTTSKKLSKGVYSFLFSFEGGRVMETREEPEVDYTAFMNAWTLIDKCLGTP